MMDDEWYVINIHLNIKYTLKKKNIEYLDKFVYEIENGNQ